MPGRLTFIGVDGTPNPSFTRNDIGRQEAGAILAYNKLMTLTGLGAVRVPVGSYDIYVSRGPEWDLKVLRKVRVGEQAVTVRAALRRMVQTAGWLSADLHVHAACSPDSQVPMLHRVYEFVAEGVEMIAATDHNVVCDYTGVIALLGMERHLVSTPGDELTTASWGHFGILPLPQDLTRAGHGAPQARGRTAAEMFREVRLVAPEALINVHHPRIDPQIGYFTIGQYDSRSDQAGRKGFSLDVDAIEVLNGYQDADRHSVDRMIEDWLNLLNHGHLVTATGNSDTHHMTFNLGGYPRNYIMVQEDQPAAVTPQEIVRALKAHRSFFSTGPFVKLLVGGGRLGDVVPVPPRGHVRVEIEVQAAPWISVSTVSLYLGNQEHQRWSVAPGIDVVRFRQSLEVQVAHDSFVVVRVDGDRSLWPVVGDNHRYEVLPLALTNPVFLDVDGNGAYDAPLPHGKHGP